MKDHELRTAFSGQKVNFLGTKEEDVAEFVLGMLQELTIMICFSDIPSEQKAKMRVTIAVFERYLNRR